MTFPGSPTRETGAGIRPRPWDPESLFPASAPGFCSQQENSGQKGFIVPVRLTGLLRAESEFAAKTSPYDTKTRKTIVAKGIAGLFI